MGISSSNKDVEFGTFGSGRPVKRRTSFLRRFLFVAFIGGIIVSVPFAVSGWHEAYTKFLEKEPPTIQVPQVPAGVGSNGMELRIELKDEHSGLDEVIVRSEQEDQTRELFRKRYPDRKSSDIISVIVPGKATSQPGTAAQPTKEKPYIEGDFRIIISAFDKSIWSNANSITLDLKVDYSKPKVEVVSTQHNAVLGGSQLVIYRVSDNAPNVFSGVKAGEWLFPGFPAKGLDPEFEPFPDLHFSFFPVPTEFQTNLEKVTLFARDEVGNTASAGMYYHVAVVNYPIKPVKITEDFIREKVADLLPKYYALDSKVNGTRHPLTVQIAADRAALIAQFNEVNSDYRKLAERLLQPLFARPKSTKLWDGVFNRQPGAAQLAGFAEHRLYMWDGEQVGESIHYGVDLASTANSPVRAANSGVVIFADDLGLYGNTVIIDHGFGLASLYGHLSSIAVSEGDTVTTSQDVGRSGSTGFAEGDHLHFELRLHGVPVRPVEWWDTKWLRDHVDGKIEEAKKSLGLRVSTPLKQ